jgi:hypothetical protein
MAQAKGKPVTTGRIVVPDPVAVEHLRPVPHGRQYSAAKARRERDRTTPRSRPRGAPPDLDAARVVGLDVRVSLVTVSYQPPAEVGEQRSRDSTRTP